jgi:hypothetical protein
VLVMEVAQVGAVFKLGLQVGVFMWGVPVGCCEFLVSISRGSLPPHHVKVNVLGEGQKYNCNQT